MTESMFERVKVLFFGNELNNKVVYRFTDNDIEVHGTMCSEDKIPGIAGFEILSERVDMKIVEEKLQKHALNDLTEYYFFVKHPNKIDGIIKLIKKHSLGYALYGIDPDYFYSLVPLNGRKYKHVERYILDLKKEISINERIKASIKKLLIKICLSQKLYEGFVITASHGRKAQLGL